MSSHHSLGESKQISSASMDGLIIGANLENEEMNFIVPALSLENAAHEAALADGLIENSGRASLRSKKMGLRRGKWTSEEENYANKLILEFKLGTLPLTDGTTLRTFLSKLLNCDPMRISKKFVGARCIGKQVFRRRSVDLDKLTPDQIDANHQELAELERCFLEKVSQNTSKGKGGTAGHDDDEEVIGVGGVDDLAWPSHSSAANGGVSSGAAAAGLRGASGRASATQPSLYSRPIQHSDSASEMLDFQNIMNSSGGLSQLASQALYYENLNPYQNYGSGNGAGMTGSGFPRQSSLEVLCALDGTSGPNSMDNFGGLYKNDSFSWGKNGELSGLTATSAVDMNAINSNYYSNTSSGSTVGGNKMMMGPDGRSMDTNNQGSSNSYYGSNGAGMSGAAASLPYSSSAEWPSMNNLVVAAETIESLGSMNSLYGGGLVDTILQKQQQVKQESFPFANQAQLHMHTINGGSTNGSKPSPSHVGGTTSQNSLQYDRSSNHSRGSRASATPPAAMTLLRDRSGSEGEVALNMASAALGMPSMGGGASSNNASENQGGGTGGAGNDDVGLPIDEEDDEGPPTGGTNSVSNHSYESSRSNMGGAVLQIDREALKAVDNIPLQQQEYTPITNMLRNNSYYIEKLAQLRASYGDQAAYEMLNTTEANGALPMKLSAMSRNTSSLSVTSNVPKNSSISDFWMLVGFGDLPRPDQDVLSSTIGGEVKGAGGEEGLLGGGSSDKSSNNLGEAASQMTAENTSTSTTSAAPSSPLRITADYPTGVPAHKPPGSPRIAPDLLPPHLQRLAALKHSRPASSDSLAAEGVESGCNSDINVGALSGSSQKQQKKRVKIDGEDSPIEETLNVNQRMALKVEVAGLGICRTSTPYSVFIVCVQQEKFEAWTVYRRYNSFNLLRDQLIPTHPGIPPIPHFDADNLNYENLENCRNILDKWLQLLASNSFILKMQSMYQFLCIDANMPPPYLDIHWRKSSNGSYDEMDMDDMFEKHAESHDEGDMYEEEADADDSEEEIDEMRLSCSGVDPQHVFNMDDHGKNSPRKSKARGAVGHKQPHKKRAASGHHYEETETDAQDGLDIQSLSVVEAAEFIYDKIDEGKPADASASGVKRTINLDAFHIIKVIGKGSFGKVFLVRDKASNTIYALKVLKKDYIIRKNQVEHTKTERSVLGYAKHPFIVGLNMAFQTNDKLFFVLDYCSGGELFFHLGKVGRFTEERSKFYAAQIILALEYVHKLNVIYRDLKPENVLLDHLGNIRLTDFGLSKEGVKDDSSGANSFCGTPEYIAPEVLLRQGHGRAVDWWSLGALTYEMITGLPPFYSRNRETMFEKIMKAQLTFPPQISETAKDLLSHLLVRDPKQRLGSGENDAEDIKAHPFFHDVNWTKLATGTMNPPWVPSVAGSLDTSQFDQEFTSMMPIVSPDVRDNNFGSMDKAFEGFTFVDESAAQHMTTKGAASYKGKHAVSGAQATLLNMKQKR